MRPLPRRSVMAGAAATVSAGAFRPAIAQPAPPRGEAIHIGCVTTLTGSQEILGRPILTGAEIAAEQINMRGGVLGRPIVIVPGNGGGDAAIAAATGKTLVDSGVRLFCGAFRNPVALALWPIVEASNSVLITCAAASPRLTHEMFNRHCFRVSDQVLMREGGLAHLMAERYPDVVDWLAVIPDTEYGHSAHAAFRDGLLRQYPALASKTANLADPIVTTFGQLDYRKQLAEIAAGPARGIFIALGGDDAVAFYQQAVKLGTTDKMAVLADAINEFIVPFSLGGDVPDRLWLAMSWYYGGYQNTPMGRALYEDNLRHTGDPMPIGFLNEGHSAVYAYAAAITAAGSTETAAVIHALEGLSFDTAKGRVTFRAEDHQAICDVNFVQVKRIDGEPGFDIAEFVRYDGASVIEAPSPGKPAVLRAPI